MASRKYLKKEIKYLSDCIIGYGIVASAQLTDEKRQEMNNLILETFSLRDEMIRRISYTEPGSVKLFYKKLKEDFSAQVSDIIDSLGSLS